jgi:hypothetical protein
MRVEEAVRKKGSDVPEIILSFKLLWLLGAALAHIRTTNARCTACPAVANSKLGRHGAKYCSLLNSENTEIYIRQCVEDSIRPKVTCLKLTEEA